MIINESIEQNATSSKSEFTFREKIITITSAIIIVFFMPYAYFIDLGVGPDVLLAILWERTEFQVLPWSLYNILILSAFEWFPFYLYRFVVLYKIWKYSLGKEKTRKLIIHGLVCELIPLLISIPGALFLDPQGHNYIPILIPIPILLFYCISLTLYNKHCNLRR